ncbi:hypothetical protein R3P38DRAFT_2920910 [Favolaschia claudopus]|uniref:Uncharacterized protein n=1 Tax=Favolaschia claudopus TaxID=2862362 RepID=A0AAW0C2P4_9AGAR
MFFVFLLAFSSFAAAVLNVNTPITAPGTTLSLVDLGQQQGPSLTWVVNVPPGVQYALTIRDNAGSLQSSGPFDVAAGSSTTCIGSGGGPSNSASNTGGGSSTGGQSSSTAQSSLPSSPSGSASQTSPPPQSSDPSGPPPAGSGSKKKSLAGPIAGGVVGGLILITAVLAFFMWRRRRQTAEGGSPFPEGFDNVAEKQLPPPPPLSVTNDTAHSARDWTPEQLFTTLPSGETQLTSLPAQTVPQPILAEEEKARARVGFIQQEINELQQLADVSSASSAGRSDDSSNAELLDEMRRLRQQMQVIEQRMQASQATSPPGTEAPPEYSKAS